MKVAILVTHLLGTGHLARAAKIADALAQAGHDARVLSGGTAAPNAAPKHAKLCQLPPLRADGPEFKALLQEDGSEVDEDFLEDRCELADSLLRDFAPDILITELYPFGRRKLAAEFKDAIRVVRDLNPKALILTSIRDILQMPRKPGRKEEAEAVFEDQYDGALFHGADALIPLSGSWPLPEGLKSKLLETGYIGGSERPEAQPNGEIIVAAGGGAVGDALFEASIDAAKIADLPMRILVGGAEREARIAGFRERADGANITVEGVRPDFRALLAGCEASILQCGYNTALDIVATEARVVFCPFEGPGGETEQLMRSKAFQERFGSGLVREKDLSAAALIEALSQLRSGPRPDYSAVALGGAERSVTILEGLYNQRINA